MTTLIIPKQKVGDLSRPLSWVIGMFGVRFRRELSLASQAGQTLPAKTPATRTRLVRVYRLSLRVRVESVGRLVVFEACSLPVLGLAHTAISRRRTGGLPAYEPRR